VREIDLSLRANLPTGTNVLIPGFASKGPTDEVIQVTSQSEFEQIYGRPSTPAERYFYHSVRPLFNSPANILTYRLPYGEDTGAGFGSNYGALAYPCSAVSTLSSNFGTALTEYDEQSTDVTYILGEPTHVELTRDEYYGILGKNPQYFQWGNTPKTSFNSVQDLSGAAMIVLNKGQTTIDQKFQGFYIGAIDNTNLNPATDFDGILSVKTVTQSAGFTTAYTSLPSSRLDFALSAISDNTATTVNTFDSSDDSISEVMENVSLFDISSNQFDDTVTLGVVKLSQSPFTSDTIKLAYNISETYVGSFDTHRQINNQNGGPAISYSIETRENASPNVVVMTNEYVNSKNGSTWLDINGVPTKKVRFTSSRFANVSAANTNIVSLSSSLGATTSAQAETIKDVYIEATATLGAADNLYALGAYAEANPKTKKLGSIPRKLDRLFDSVENIDMFDIDLTVDGGLTTINATAEYTERTTGTKYFDDTMAVGAIDGFYKSNILEISNEAKAFRADYNTIFQRFSDFAEKRRKDHMFIGDLPRQFFVQGSNFLTLEDKSKNFSLNVLKPIQAVMSLINTSYAATYGNWGKVYDSVLDDQFWAPMSGTMAAMMANTDDNFQPWYAPAGFTRGLVSGVNDLAIYPKQKQRDQLYKISVNPVAFFPGEGFVTFGQKTMQAKPSAFDRINVRRLFLWLEKATRRTAKYFVFEPNTLITRTRVVNVLDPIFKLTKNTEGVYDYRIICDERNNTNDVIDQNELVIDIYIKPVRAAEFILVNFLATQTGANFDEIINGTS
jgi:hypothetical protein